MAEPSLVKRALIEIRRLKAQLAEARTLAQEPVAIIGMALRFPGGIVRLDDFWQLLTAGGSAVTPIPAERWDRDALYHADADQPGKTYARHLAFINDVDQFDAEFFGITPREAESMDPQHRILLELSWEALEHAGIPPTQLAGTNAGVYVALCHSDYGHLLLERRDDIDAYSSLGLAGSIAAGRLSYFFDLKGPSLVVDTSCSSSLMAVHLACKGLTGGECGIAIVGSTNLTLRPEPTISFSHARMLSPDGQCKTFDAEANGYVRGEGCAVVILKRLRDAHADGDNVLAVIRGTAANHDGRSAGLTAPNGPAQEAVIRTALQNARVRPRDVDYVEAHGTGTPLGDPIELQALGAVYGKGRTGADPLLVGSVKTNIGHLEAAAGLAGLVKVVLSLWHEALPSHRNFATPNPYVAWNALPLQVVSATRAWPRTERPRRAGLSAFGFSGTNLHVVLEEAPIAPDPPPISFPADQECLFVLSARSADALRGLAARYATWLDESAAELPEICFSAAVGRSHHTHRLGVVARDRGELAAALRQWLEQGAAPRLRTGIVAAPRRIDVTEIDGADASALQTLYLVGGEIDWKKFWGSAEGRPRRKLDLPSYAFQRQRFWRPKNSASPPSGTRTAPQLNWQKLLATLATQSETGPLGWDPTRYATRWRRLDELTIGHVVNTLAALGEFASSGARASVDQLVKRHGVVALYRNLVARWLKLLSNASILSEAGEYYVSVSPLCRRDLTTIWRDIEDLLGDDPDTLTYLKRASEKLIELLTGRVSPLEVLFERGSLDRAEGIYERSPSARYLNSIVAAAVRSALEDHRGHGPFRMLEAGAGTGGTTARLADFFPNDGEYWFTDLSEAFLARGRRKFGANPAFRFTKFNLDLPVPAELPFGQFDVALAANVVHATRDVGATLDNMRALLKPGGLLVLIESTTHFSHFDLTIAFVEGWSNFADRYRRDHPLLPADRWLSLLRERGFIAAERFPRGGALCDNLGQHIIIARNAVDAFSAVSIEARAPAAASDGVVNGTAPEPPRLKFEGPIDAAHRDALEAFVRRCAAAVMHLDGVVRPGSRDRFSDLGMDSLMALQLQATLGEGLGLPQPLPATIAFDAGTVEALTDQILRLGDSVPTAISREVLNGGAVAATPMSGLLRPDELETLSDDEVATLLAQRLSPKPVAEP